MGVVVIKPKIGKQLWGVLFVISIWAAAIALPPQQLSYGTALLLITAPVIIPILLILLISYTRLELYDDGRIVLRVGGMIKDDFHVRNILRYQQDYLFRNGIKGFGAGKALYVSYKPNGTTAEKELSLSVGAYGSEEIKRIVAFIERNKSRNDLLTT
ncbi:MAG: hypothetical protein QY323_03015 [Patescibacteria group bacterium]|nr:MAG: hypothetical protein QY323_03015 [Patescibacteria group bacterium]